MPDACSRTPNSKHCLLMPELFAGRSGTMDAKGQGAKSNVMAVNYNGLATRATYKHNIPDTEFMFGTVVETANIMSAIKSKTEATIVDTMLSNAHDCRLLVPAQQAMRA